MADGFAQATRGIGLATVTSGPGLTHAATSVLAASREHTPMVVVAGEVPLRRPEGLQALQSFDQRRFAEASEALFQRVYSAASLAEDVRAAFYLARTRRQPVVLGVPLDVQSAELAGDWSYEPSTSYLPANVAIPLADEAGRFIIRLIEASSRPLVVAGRGASTPQAREALEALADAIGALLGTTLPAKGLFDGNPWSVGVVGGYSRPTGRELIRAADLVLAFGAELGHFTTQAGTLFEGRPVVRVDSAAADASIPLGSASIVQADATEAAAGLARLLTGPQQGFRTPEIRTRLAEPESLTPVETGGLLDPRALMLDLGERLPADALVVVGGGHFTSFPCLYLERPSDGEFLFPFGAAAVGQALPFAIGVAVGRPDRPVVVIEGDGSLMMNIQEMDTAARLGLRLFVLVMNDGALTAETIKLAAGGYDPGLATFPSPDFSALARAFGWEGILLGAGEDLDGAIERFAAGSGPVLVDARISPEVRVDPNAVSALGATVPA
jgi:thiamine pyrophosphate-dependent acetolactate synthase large subunit-like protein